MRSAWLLGLTLFCASPSGASECVVSAEEIDALEWDDLIEIQIEPECLHLREAMAERIDARIDEQSLEADADEDELRHARMWSQGLKLQAALARRDIDQALELLDGWRVETRRAFDAEESESAAPIAAAGDESTCEACDRIKTIDAILRGQPALLPAAEIAAPEPDWVLRLGWCGTPAAVFHHSATSLPDPADAWLARGEPLMALQGLLHAQWVDAVSLGMLPPRLAEYAHRSIGAEAYAAEIERALAQIRIDERADGRHASMPLFGLQLPLPLGHADWRDEEGTIRVYDPAALADFVRRLFEGSR